jgi:N-acetylglucosaminyl-diphospho-decaprenol L-rhamnosyltransferase
MTSRCVASVGGEADVVVLDNGALPERDGRLEAAVGGAEVVRWRENLPFAQAFDRAAVEAERRGHDRFLFLTNDVTLEPGCLSALDSALGDAAAVGPVQVHASDPGRVFHAGGGFERHRWASVVLDGGRPLSEVAPDGVREVDWLDGAAVLVRLASYREVGPMWPGYDFYWEDSDWGLRARAMGHRLLVAMGARARHETSASAGAYPDWKRELLWRNRMLCARRLASPEEWRRLRRYFMVSALTRLAKRPGDPVVRRQWRATLDLARGETPVVRRPEAWR